MACGGLSGAAATVRVRQRAFVRGGRKRYVDLRKQCVRALSCCKAVAGVSGGVLEHDCGAADAGACNLGKFGALNWYVDAGRVLLQAFFIRAL